MAKTIEQIKAEQFKIQKAVKFLTDACLDSKGNQKIANPKPVVIHSLRVGFDLLKRDYNNDVVVTAILHDLIEDAGVPIAEIKRRFGKKVAEIVEAVSWNEKIPNHMERFSDTHHRTKEVGRDAVLVSLADHLDNADYYQYAKSKLTRKMVLKKWKIFFKEVASLISDEPIYQDYKDKLESIR